MNWTKSVNRINMVWNASNVKWLSKYLMEYKNMQPCHPIYKKGWIAHALSAHRFIPRLVWYKIKEHFKDDIILDFGTYDGTLVKALRVCKIEAYGVDEIDWSEMWDMLEVSPFIKDVKPSIVVALNICHNWTSPLEFVNFMKSKYDPRIILADRDQKNPHSNNKIWNTKRVEEAGFTSYTFSQADPQRDLLVWSNS